VIIAINNGFKIAINKTICSSQQNILETYHNICIAKTKPLKEYLK